MEQPETNGMTPEQWRAHVRKLADSRCQNKHRDYYDSLIRVGGEPDECDEPPCHNCVRETEEELKTKRGKAHGTLLSPEEAAEFRRRHNLPEQFPDDN